MPLRDVDFTVRLVTDGNDADQAVLVVNAVEVTGSPVVGDVPVVQADGSVAWGASTGSAGLAVIRRNSAAMSAVLG